MEKYPETIVKEENFMLHFFGKRELFSTFDLKDLLGIRPALGANHIDCDVKVLDRKNPGPFFDRDTKKRIASFRENPDMDFMYVIRVNKEDLERGREVLRQIGK
ncbi:MAG: hypothetical protein Q4E91_00720 [Lachnospiraceae bacterium]|nr:hypothetical protein [Lachnospiraceae bacterium]